MHSSEQHVSHNSFFFHTIIFGGIQWRWGNCLHVYRKSYFIFVCCCLLVIMWFLFGEVSSSSGCLGWATLFYCGTPFHIIIFQTLSNPVSSKPVLLTKISSKFELFFPNGMLFQMIAPEYDKIFLNKFSFCLEYQEISICTDRRHPKNFSF